MQLLLYPMRMTRLFASPSKNHVGSVTLALLRLDLSTTIASADRTNANTMQPQNIVALISILDLASGPASKGQLTPVESAYSSVL